MRFTKMQGCGNDYIYINCFAEKVRSEEHTSELQSQFRISYAFRGCGFSHENV